MDGPRKPLPAGQDVEFAERLARLLRDAVGEEGIDPALRREFDLAAHRIGRLARTIGRRSGSPRWPRPLFPY